MSKNNGRGRNTEIIYPHYLTVNDLAGLPRLFTEYFYFYLGKPTFYKT